MADSLILLFARPPVEGRVKTRLIADIGSENALAVYLYCLNHSLSLLRDNGFEYQLWLSEADRTGKFKGETIHLQQGADLGQRMLHSLQHCLQNHQKVMLIGSDCLDMNATTLNQVKLELEVNDLVFVPAEDGGYVLIAVRDQIDPLIFDNIPWGTDRVMVETLKRIEKLNLKVCLLKPLKDIDRLDDLKHYPDLHSYL